MDKGAKTAVVEFAMRSLSTAVHEEVRDSVACRETSLTGFICSRPLGHPEPHIATGSETVCHIWFSWEERLK